MTHGTDGTGDGHVPIPVSAEILAYGTHGSHMGLGTFPLRVPTALHVPITLCAPIAPHILVAQCVPMQGSTTPAHLSPQITLGLCGQIYFPLKVL